MKKALIITLAVLAVSFLGAGVSHAVILDFNDLEAPGDSYAVMSNYSNSGFLLTNNIAADDAFASPQQSYPWYFGSANLFNNYVDAWTTLSYSGGLFNISSIDVHRLYAPPQDPTIIFYAYDSGDNPIDSFTYSFDNYIWNTVDFGSSFDSIASLKWQQVDPFHSFDNIVLNQTRVIPEPSSMLLFGLGLLLIWCHPRRCHPRSSN